MLATRSSAAPTRSSATPESPSAPQLPASCAVHVHLSVAGSLSLRLAKVLTKASLTREQDLFDMIPSHRRGYRYCMPNSSGASFVGRTIEEALSTIDEARSFKYLRRIMGAKQEGNMSARYFLVNFQSQKDAFDDKGRTVDFRGMAGCFDAEEIVLFAKRVAGWTAGVFADNFAEYQEGLVE